MHGHAPPRTAVLACAAAAASAAATAAVVLADVRVADGDSAGQLALDSVAATVGLLLAYLVYGRYRQSLLVRDVLLCVALLVLSLSNTALSVVPQVVAGESRLATASAVAGLCAAVLFAVAVWAPPWQLPGRLIGFVVVSAPVAVVAMALVVARVVPRLGAASAESFGATDDPLITGSQLAAAAAFAVAAAGWCRTRDDRLAPALAVASVLAAASRVDFALATTSDASWVTAGTLLRIGFYLTLIAAAVVEIQAYWTRVAEAAVLEERRRIARDLHDGLAQELAFAATQARVLGERSEHPTRARLVAAAAERALDESRRAIAALTRPLDEPLEVALAQCAEEVCDRFDAALVLDVQAGVLASSDLREALLRITREAVSNAARHGAARSVTVRLSGPGPVRLAVEDDGTGFDPADLRHLSGRFGLVSMRERAQSLGGSFSLQSVPSGGTRVEVVVP